MGVWRTRSPDYENRFFEISEDLIVFGTGGGNRETYSISSIREAPDDNGLLYTLSYYATAGEDKHGFFFYYDAAGGGVIRFKNQQEMAWTTARDR